MTVTARATLERIGSPRTGEARFCASLLRSTPHGVASILFLALRDYNEVGGGKERKCNAVWFLMSWGAGG